LYRVIHQGGHYCSSCYVREAPQLGDSCPQCLNNRYYTIRTTDKLRRKIDVLIERATVHLQVATNAVTVANHEEDVQVAVQAPWGATLACREAWPILEAVEEIVARIQGIHLEKAVAAGDMLIPALQSSKEVAHLVTEILVTVAARTAEPT
ncbi:hypothetical protein QBC45DRAFT_330458, partial [Copromyces sp. CBS 386.78]